MHISRWSIAHRTARQPVLRSAPRLIVVRGMCLDGQGTLLNSRYSGRR
jgi:hypothetical protein